jgi:hypothetical protein
MIDTALQKCLILSLFILIILPSSTATVELNSTNTWDFINDSNFIKQVSVAAVGAILAFLFSFLLSQIAERRKPRKQLSYDLIVENGLVKIEQNIEKKVKILYNDKEIERLFHVICDIKNSGKKVIKNEFIRFEFPQGTEIIDFYYDPKPEREFDVSEVVDSELQSYERRFKIGHFEHGQKIGFRFIISGDIDAEPRIHSFNEEGDVEFVPRSISKALDERRQVTRFIQLYFLFLIVPSIFGILSLGILDDIAAGIAKLAILVSMLPVLKPASRVIADAIMRLARPRDDLSKSSGFSLAISDSPSAKIHVNTNNSVSDVKF